MALELALGDVVLATQDPSLLLTCLTSQVQSALPNFGRLAGAPQVAHSRGILTFPFIYLKKNLASRGACISLYKTGVVVRT